MQTSFRPNIDGIHIIIIRLNEYLCAASATRSVLVRVVTEQNLGFLSIRWETNEEILPHTHLTSCLAKVMSAGRFMQERRSKNTGVQEEIYFGVSASE